MQIHSDEDIMYFKVGDIVKAIGKPQLLKVIECKTAMIHVHIESGKSVYYKCEWRRPNGTTYNAWFEQGKLERLSKP